MENLLIIEAGIAEIRLALLEGDTIKACAILRESDRSDLGARFYARVRSISKQSDSAFIDLGEGEAFLSFRRAKAIAPMKNPKSISACVCEGQVIEVEIIRDGDGADGKLPLVKANATVNESAEIKVGRLGTKPTLIERAVQKTKNWAFDHVIYDHAITKALFNNAFDNDPTQEIAANAFSECGMDAYLDEAISGSINLPSGGKLHLQQTRALWVFDIDTASGGKGRGAQSNRLNTNLEAARAIGAAINILNIGGLMVIDFIDLDRPNDQKSVLATLDKALAADGERLPRSGFSKFSLVEIKRRKDGPSLIEYLGEKSGHYSIETQGHNLLREALKIGRSAETGKLHFSLPHRLNDWMQKNTSLLEILTETTRRELDFSVSSQQIAEVALIRR